MIITDEKERLINDCEARRIIICDVKCLIEKMKNEEDWYRSMTIDYDKEIRNNELYVKDAIIVLEDSIKKLKEKFNVDYDINTGVKKKKNISIS